MVNVRLRIRLTKREGRQFGQKETVLGIQITAGNQAGECQCECGGEVQVKTVKLIRCKDHGIEGRTRQEVADISK